jgi:hypothetical protein
MNNRIKQLQQEIEQEQSKIRSCKHDFSEPKYDPETVTESYGYKAVVMGSDVWGEPEGYRQVQKPRWSRKCSVCGFIQYTYEQETVVVKTQPKF